MGGRGQFNYSYVKFNSESIETITKKLPPPVTELSGILWKRGVATHVGWVMNFARWVESNSIYIMSVAPPTKAEQH
jgi:hypothetical protein